jgi:hypothetical protein
MKLRHSSILLLLLGFLFTSVTVAQDRPLGPAEAAADLRVKLAEVQFKESDLRMRLDQLDEALKPDNIERSLAGVGSTRPEELREQRRRELTIERDGVRRQLDLLATSRTRLESAIQAADIQAYQQSAQAFSAMNFLTRRRVLIAAAIFFGLIAVEGLIILIRRF